MNNRRKLLASIGALGLFPLAKLGLFVKKKKETPVIAEIKMVKMLTQDGKLVEVDASKISGVKTKVSMQQIHEWGNIEL
jgi:hypothetical protein